MKMLPFIIVFIVLISNVAGSSVYVIKDRDVSSKLRVMIDEIRQTRSHLDALIAKEKELELPDSSGNYSAARNAEKYKTILSVLKEHIKLLKLGEDFKGKLKKSLSEEQLARLNLT